MVVAASCVERDIGLIGLRDALPLLTLPIDRAALRQVVHACCDDAECAFNQFSWAGSFEAMCRHIVHFPVKSLSQPGLKSGFGASQIDVCNTNLRKSQLTRPLPYPVHPCLTRVDFIEMSHAPIVKTESWPDERAMASFAVRLARQPGLRESFISLHGQLGAGKTTVVRHVLRAYGVQGRIKSPTYALAECYEVSALPVWHFDFFRFKDPSEWQDAGMRDLFASPGLKMAEWPEKVGDLLPMADLQIHLTARSNGSRDVRLVAQTPRGESLLANLEAREQI